MSPHQINLKRTSSYQFYSTYNASMYNVVCMLSCLQDVLKNENIKLDWDFKVSLLTDLVRVRMDLII